jgi:hypothetical protein
MTVSKNGGGPRASSLVGLSDVTITSPQEGQTLVYDSSTQKFVNGLENTITTPSFTLASPISGGVNTTFTASAYALAQADTNYTHVNTDWQFASDAEFNTIVFQSLADTSNKTSITTNIALGTGTIYARVRYRNQKEVSAYGTQTYVVNQVTTINTSGNFSVPANTNQLTVRALGAGASGGNEFPGGSGGTVLSQINVTPSSTIAVTIGAGPVPTNTSGPNGGGSTTFGNTITAGGGQAIGNGNVPGGSGTGSGFAGGASANYANGVVTGGGGGAGAAGQNGSTSGNQGVPGLGGLGIVFPDGTRRGGGGAGYGNSNSQIGSIQQRPSTDGGGQSGVVDGNTRTNAQSGTANYGGGGGASQQTIKGTGGSGVVFVTYNI